MRLGFLARPRIRFRDVDVAEQMEVLGSGRPSVLTGGP
jgi:hypothetical protein